MDKNKYVELYKKNFEKYCGLMQNKTDIKAIAEINGKIIIIKEVLKDFGLSDQEFAEIDQSILISKLTAF